MVGLPLYDKIPNNTEVTDIFAVAGFKLMISYRWLSEETRLDATFLFCKTDFNGSPMTAGLLCLTEKKIFATYILEGG